MNLRDHSLFICICLLYLIWADGLQSWFLWRLIFVEQMGSQVIIKPTKIKSQSTIVALILLQSSILQIYLFFTWRVNVMNRITSLPHACGGQRFPTSTQAHLVTNFGWIRWVGGMKLVLEGLGRPAPTLVPCWSLNPCLQGTSVGVGLPQPF
jgi:hypothetical protein